MAETELPQLPRLTLVDRLRILFNPYKYNKELQQLQNAKGKLVEQTQEIANGWSEIEVVKTNARSEAEQILQDAEKRAAEIIQRAESKNDQANQMATAAEAKMAEAEAKMAEADAKMAEADAKMAKATAMTRQAKSQLEIFRGDNGIGKNVPDAAINRDLLLKVLLGKIRLKCQELNQTIGEANSLDESTPADNTMISREKAKMQAAVLAGICAYRDSLPEAERPAFGIDGKSATAFLKELAEKISNHSLQEKNSRNIVYVSVNPNGHSSPCVITTDALAMVGKTYKECVQAIGLNPDLAYPSAGYAPFDSALPDDDHRSAAYVVFSNCAAGKECGLSLKGQLHQRTTNDQGKQPAIEKNIGELAAEVEEFDR